MCKRELLCNEKIMSGQKVDIWEPLYVHVRAVVECQGTVRLFERSNNTSRYY